MPEMLRIRPWPDPIIDTLGHDPRSHYAESFYLPTLGPTAFVLLRHLAHVFDELGADLVGREEAEQAVIELPFADVAQSIGLGPRDGESSPLVRTFDRLKAFDFAIQERDGTFAVRRTLPPVSRRHVHRLPGHVRRDLAAWMEESASPRQMAEERARRTALTMVGLGAGVDMVEQTLQRLGFPPIPSRNAATWAWETHESLDEAA